MAFFAAGTWAAISAGTAAYGAYSSAQAQNKASEVAQDNATRRYALESGVAESQMEEQQELALEKMTEITRGFLKAKGQATAVQAETMVTGNVAKRLEADRRIKESEAKGKVAKEIDTNVINIAQGMIANKIDTEAILAEAESKKKNSLAIATDMTMTGLSGYSSGYSTAKQMGAN
jgi:pimeloyl-CoA synthetase